MKFQIMLEILFILLVKKKVSASYLASRFEVSQRTIYRYIDEMTCSNVPIDVVRGAAGGIRISDAFKLPKGMFTKEEYQLALKSMIAMNEQLRDPVLESAIAKLSETAKTDRSGLEISGNLLVDGGAWGDERKLSETVALVSDAVEQREALQIDYLSREGERTQRTILPHLLVLKQNVWYVYAYCRMRKEFRLFKLGRIRTVMRAGETFERMEFKREDIPLSFWNRGDDVNAKFALSPQALPLAEEWLGVTSVYEADGNFYAEVVLPDDESLVGKILSMGAGVKVLAPDELKERVAREAQKIANGYHE